MSFLRSGVFLGSFLPGLYLAAALFGGAFGGLGTNPVEALTRSTGTWCLVMLCLTLSVTPLRQITGWAGWLRVRRMLGLAAFAYGAVHLLTYVWMDQWFDLPAILRDVFRRPFITAGFVAFVLMLPLALSSTDSMMRRLGKRWGQLHRAVYGVALAGVLHFWWHKAGKNDLFEPAVYASVITVLLGWRLARWMERGGR